MDHHGFVSFGRAGIASAYLGKAGSQQGGKLRLSPDTPWASSKQQAQAELASSGMQAIDRERSGGSTDDRARSSGILSDNNLQQHGRGCTRHAHEIGTAVSTSVPLSDLHVASVTLSSSSVSTMGCHEDTSGDPPARSACLLPRRGITDARESEHETPRVRP